MLPLIDGDILLHEIGWSSEFKDKETGEEVLMDFDHCWGLFTKKIELICEEVGATQPPLIFFTDSEWLAEKDGRVYVPTFRHEIAVTKPYKGGRKDNKPHHFYNLLVTALASYECVIARAGMEADDEMGIRQSETLEVKGLPYETVICSRDKDLRQIPGWHYSWECGSQASIGPVHTDEKGFLKETRDGKIIGYGLTFLFYQMIVGDSVDNIPGLPKYGPKAALKYIVPNMSVENMYNTVLTLYEKEYGEDGWYVFQEQGDLLYIRQKHGEDFHTKMKKVIRWGDE